MRIEKLWDLIYKLQKYQYDNGNEYVDFEHSYCRYTRCNSKQHIQIYNKDEWETEWICKECFVDNYGKTDYCVVLPTIYDDNCDHESIFEKYGVKND